MEVPIASADKVSLSLVVLAWEGTVVSMPPCRWVQCLLSMAQKDL
eukprot:COSAG03_NODE_541_length_7067_cov_2.200201_3_plen_45_part_00